MNGKCLVNKNEGQEEALWKMRECLLILKNSHGAITTILKEIGNDSNASNSSIIEILHEEILVMNSETERMKKIIEQRLV